MKEDENKTVDLVEHSIRRQLKMLDKTIEPDKDLWPEIAEKIRGIPQHEGHQPVTRRWLPAAMAASLLIVIGALGFTGYSNYTVQHQDDSIIVDGSTIALIEQPFKVARSGYQSVLVANKQQISPHIRALLEKNLQIIDDATQEIRLALKENPNDPFLTDALLLIRQKELQLLNQITTQNLGTI